MTKCKRAIDQIRQEQGREPTNAEIAALIGIVVEHIALKEVEVEERYKRHIREIEERHKERTGKSKNVSYMIPNSP